MRPAQKAKQRRLYLAIPVLVSRMDAPASFRSWIGVRADRRWRICRRDFWQRPQEDQISFLE